MIRRPDVRMPQPPPIRAGAPAVVLAGGVGVPARKWAGVIAELDDARVLGDGTWLIVDRPGLGRRHRRGFGDSPDFADEVARLVHDLHRCRDAGAAPVILVAHSAASFLAEAAVRANPGLVDGVLLLDVSVVEDAGRPVPLFDAASHLIGLLLEPLVRRAWPGMRRGELSSLLLENAVFSRWARDLRELRDRGFGAGAGAGSGSAATTGSTVPGMPGGAAVTAVTDVVAVPMRRLSPLISLPRTATEMTAGEASGETTDETIEARAAAVAASSRGRDAHLRTWRALAGGVRDGDDPLAVTIFAPCGHMVMTDRPAHLAAEIASLITRAGRRAAP